MATSSKAHSTDDSVTREQPICARCQQPRTDYNNKERSTSLCGKCFMTLTSFSKCSQCDFAESREKVIAHARSGHKSFCPGGCCKSVKDMVMKHVTTLNPGEGFTCVYNNCRFSADLEAELAKHLMDIHVTEILAAGRVVVPIGSPPRIVYICRTCSRRFDTWDTLDNHCHDMIGHVAAGRMFCCNSCYDVTTKNLTSMCRHMNEKHSQAAYSCQACIPSASILGTGSDVFEHIRVKHVSQGSTDLLCEFCHRPLTVQDAQVHFRMNHIGSFSTGGLKVIERQIQPLAFRGLYERYQFLTNKPKIPFLMCPSAFDSLNRMQLIHAAVLTRLPLDDFMKATEFPREKLLSALTERCAIPPLPDSAPISGDMLPSDVWWVIMGHMDAQSRVAMLFVSKALRSMFDASVTEKDRWKYALRNAPLWGKCEANAKKRDAFVNSKTGELLLSTFHRLYGSVRMFNALPDAEKERVRSYFLGKAQGML